jgi:FkbM family methyltransferase
MKAVMKRLVNGALRPFGARLVGSQWGPRGFVNAFRRLKTLGVEPRQIVDAGASNGSWTRECLTVFDQSRYFLVDPLPENAAPLSSLAATSPAVTVWSGALGSAPGDLRLHAHGDQTSVFEAPFNAADPTVAVEMRTLDSFLGTATLEPPQLPKLDVQGFEMDVLRGAARCMETVDVILAEVSFQHVYRKAPLAHELVAFLGERGFCVYDVCTYVQRPLDGELAQADLIFARHTSPAFGREGWR